MLRQFIKYILIIIWIASLSAMSTPLANEPENVEVNIQESSPEELELDRPSTITRRDAAMMRDMALMNQISNLDAKDIMTVQNQAMGLARSRLTMQIRRFAPEALVFYAAIGATMARKAYTDQLISGRRDPAWMENLMHEITSPMGVFSFFCFLIASGQTSYWLSQPLKPWSQKLAAQKVAYDQINSIDIKKEKNKLKKQRKNQQSKAKNLAKTTPSTPKKIHRPVQPRWMQQLHHSTFNSYKVSRFGFRQSAGLINQMGLAAGIVASNIITEVGTLMNNPAIHYCVNQLLPNRLVNKKDKLSAPNGDLVCNDAFAESMSTFKSWGPDILSVVTSAFINHALMQGLVNIKNGTVATFHSLRKVTVRSRFSLGRMLYKLTWLVPGPGTTGKVLAVAGQWSFRLFSLYTFMEINELVKHNWFHSWDENIRARDLSNSIILFMQNFDPQNQKQGLHCIGEQDDPSNCTYHPTLQHAVSTANYFKQWRRFQSTPIQMAQQNWFFYVSNTQAYFDLSYALYKGFFTSQTEPNLLKRPHYFGPVLDNTDSMDMSIFPYIQSNIPEEAQLAFQTMVHKITTHFNKTYSHPIENISNIPLNIVSSISQSSFVKKNIQLDRVFAPFHSAIFAMFPSAAKNAPIPLNTESEQLIILHKLFSVRDTSVPIEPFYDHWSEEIRLAQEVVLTENSLHWAMTCNQALDFIKISQKTEQMRKADNELFLQQLSQYGDASVALDQYLSTFNAQKNILNNCSYRKIQTFSLPDTPQQFIAKALKKTTFSTSEEAREMIQKYYHQNPERWRYEAENLLRKKVLATGSQLLTQIINQRLKQQKSRTSIYLSKEEKEQITKWQIQHYPEELITTAQALGPNHIFSQLLKELYRTDPNSGTYQYSIKPSAQGMLLTQNLNQHYSMRKQYFKMKYHPTQLNIFNTPGIMDFLVVSALCGPDLTTSSEHQAMLSKVQKVISKQSSLEKEFPDQDMDDIVQQLPVFDKSFMGESFYFYPPKVLGQGKHKAAIQRLCRTSSMEGSVHQNIYNSSFTVNGKTYHSLLQVALEHAISDTFPTALVFDTWWKEQVEPYRDLYLMLADREYLKMTKTWITPLLFQNEMAKIKSSYSLSLTKNLIPQESSRSWTRRFNGNSNERQTAIGNTPTPSTLERILPLSAEQGLFEQTKLYRRALKRAPLQQYNQITYYETENETMENMANNTFLPREESYAFSFSKGLFQNIYQEMNYWADIIMAFAQNSPKQEKIIEYLTQFIQLFELSSGHLDTLHPSSLSEKTMNFLLLKPPQITNFAQRTYLEWINEFLKPQTDTSYLQKSINICELDENQEALNQLNKFQRAHLYLHLTACLLNVDMVVLAEKLNASQIAMNVHDSLSESEFTSTQDKQIGFFYEGQDQTLNQQLLNYAFISLKNLLLETATYMEMVHAISGNKDIEEATQIPSTLIQ